MYCPSCRKRFSSKKSGPRCPFCGADGCGAGAVPTAHDADHSRLPESGSLDDRTKTESQLADSFAAGSRVAGKYEIVGELGAGGFGRVFKVRHVFRKKYYALKVPHPRFVRDEVFRKRFEREIEALERFAHPDIVLVRDCGVTEGGTPYYTMDFVEGETLRVVLHRERRLALDRAMRIGVRVLRVLEAAHEQKVIHRDLKPDNILLTQRAGREQVKVLDFGVAKLLDLVGSDTVTGASKVGTPRYMSPEQITGEGVDHRSDLFSLGIILFELLTGSHPFGRESDPLRQAAAILNREPHDPRELLPDLPRRHAEIVAWLLEKKPKRRPTSAREVLGALEEIDRAEPAPAVVSSAVARIQGAELRAPTEGVVLRWAAPGGERRFFLLFRERIGFGRGGEIRGRSRSSSGEDSVDIVLRCLPCRSEAEDPENWRRTLTLSHRVGTLFPEGSCLVVAPDARAVGGLLLNGVKCVEPVRIASDRFHIALGDRALDLDGHRRLKNLDRPGLDLSALYDGRSRSTTAFATVGYSNERCLIDHVHLGRVSNFPQHEYFLVYRQLPIGPAPEQGLALVGAGLVPEQALVVFEGGEAFLAAARGRAMVLRSSPSSGVGSAASAVVLDPGTLYPLVPGIELALGTARLRVEALDSDWFKRV